MKTRRRALPVLPLLGGVAQGWRTANALGPTIPPALLERADEVIR